MMLPDVNVVIYAFRKDVPQHALCNAWLTSLVASDGRFAMSTLVMSALVRITTNQRRSGEASTLEEAFKFCDYLLGQPNCNVVEPGERHWGIFRRLCRDTSTLGADVTDAWFAALAIEHGCEWITLDRDFARFPGLKWRVPSV
jgi:uncharacterized protein